MRHLVALHVIDLTVTYSLLYFTLLKQHLADAFVQGDVQHTTYKKQFVYHFVLYQRSTTDRGRGGCIAHNSCIFKGLSDLDPRRLAQGGAAEIGEFLDVF